MVQGGVLGNLAYREDEHGWALDLGQQSTRYEVISGPLTSNDVPGYDEARNSTVQYMNELLTSNRIRYTVPELLPGVAADHHKIGNDLLDAMKKDATPSQLAFYLLGSAVYYLCLRDTGYEATMVGIALNRLKNIPIRCPGIRIEPEGLLERFLSAEDLSGIGIRVVLADLMKPMTILVVTADPIDQAPLRLPQESRQLMQALKSANLQNAFKVEQLPSCQIRDLASGIKNYKPAILHFSGHGSEHGLCFEGPNGDAVILDPQKFAALLSLAVKEGLKGVVMNACNSQAHAHSAAEAVGQVIAMEGPLSDEAAIDFSREFYGSMGDGYTFERAFEWALVASGLVTATEDLKPCLIQAERV